MKTYNKGFIAPLLLALIALLLIGGGAYVYMQNKQVNQPTGENPTAQTTSATVVGAVYNSVYLKDSSTLLFIDNNNKTWTVDYRNANFSEYSGSYAKVSGTNGLRQTTLQDWLKVQQNVADLPPKDGPGAPGSITITGILNVDGTFVASSIKIDGQ